MADFADVGLRSDYETAIHDAFQDKGITTIRSIDVFPPLRPYTDSEIAAGEAALKIDAILKLTPQGVTTGSSTSYSGLTGNFNTHQTIDAIYSEAAVEDVKTHQEVYRASISTSLGELTSSISARYSAAYQLRDDLLNNNFLESTFTPKVHHRSANPDD